MSSLPVFQQTTYHPLMALSLVDRLAQALRVGGAFPQPLGDILCEAVAQTAPVARVLDPARVLSTFRNRSGYLILDGTWRNPDHPERSYPLGAGTYLVRLRGELYQDAEFPLTWPPTEGQRRIPVPQPGNPDNVELLPSSAYPMPDVSIGRLQLGPTIVRGAAFAADGTPLPGLAVEIINLPLLAPPELPPLADWPFLRTRSSTSGDWALVVPGRRYIDNAPEIPAPATMPVTKQLSVRIGYPGGPVTKLQNVVLGGEHSVSNTALRGQVLGPGGRPLAGVPITTSVNARSSITGADGNWSLYFDLNQAAVPQPAVTASPPGRAPKTDTSATLQPGGTVVVPTFHFA